MARIIFVLLILSGSLGGRDCKRNKHTVEEELSVATASSANEINSSAKRVSHGEVFDDRHNDAQVLQKQAQSSSLIHVSNNAPEMLPLTAKQVVIKAQESWEGTAQNRPIVGWSDHATQQYLLFALQYAETYPGLKKIAWRLLARMSTEWQDLYDENGKPSKAPFGQEGEIRAAVGESAQTVFSRLQERASTLSWSEIDTELMMEYRRKHSLGSILQPIALSSNLTHTIIQPALLLGITSVADVTPTHCTWIDSCNRATAPQNTETKLAGLNKIMKLQNTMKIANTDAAVQGAFTSLARAHGWDWTVTSVEGAARSRDNITSATLLHVQTQQVTQQPYLAFFDHRYIEQIRNADFKAIGSRFERPHEMTSPSSVYNEGLTALLVVLAHYLNDDYFDRMTLPIGAGHAKQDLGPVKKSDRIRVKVRDDYFCDPAPQTQHIKDVLRKSFVFEDAKDQLIAFNQIEEQGFDVLKVKNDFLLSEKVAREQNRGKHQILVTILFKARQRSGEPLTFGYIAQDGDGLSAARKAAVKAGLHTDQADKAVALLGGPSTAMADPKWASEVSPLLDLHSRDVMLLAELQFHVKFYYTRRVAHSLYKVIRATDLRNLKKDCKPYRHLNNDVKWNKEELLDGFNHPLEDGSPGPIGQPFSSSLRAWPTTTMP